MLIVLKLHNTDKPKEIKIICHPEIITVNVLF